MASGALPPAFPAVRIDGELYWDGGILSNTPVEAVFDDYPRRNSLVFAVHIWNPHGREPATIWQVLNRQKDIQYSSRARQPHRATEAAAPAAPRRSPNWWGACPSSCGRTAEVQDLAGYGCLTRMHVVRLLAPALEGEDHTKDIDFSPAGIRARWEAGYADTRRVIAKAPW